MSASGLARGLGISNAMFARPRAAALLAVRSRDHRTPLDISGRRRERLKPGLAAGLLERLEVRRVDPKRLPYPRMNRYFNPTYAVSLA
jgi:hypothetical protein